MIDVQPAQPSVFDAGVSVTPAASALLTRPSGTALHVIADAEYITVCRSLIGTCTREEWDNPSYRRLAIARAWERAVTAIRADDEEFVSFLPVTLYRHPVSNAVVLADISLPGKPSRLITPEGKRVLAAPADLALLLPQRTTYARWAEGPLPHVSLEMQQAATPDEDRDIQYLRHQNRALRELIDGALGPAEWAATPNDAAHDDGLVDFRIRGAFRRQELRRFVSKQTGDVSALVIGGAAVAEHNFDPSTESGLDALLEAD